MKTKEYAPIAVFTYARMEHTKKMIESLLENEEASNSVLYIFSDGAKNDTKKNDVEKVRNYIRTINGFKQLHIIERNENWGLSKNLIDGISKIVKKHKRVIVVEDDLILSKYFLRFMNDALDLYENDERVSAISGFVNPVKTQLPQTFFLRYFACWGWATWERGWNLFNADAIQLKELLLAQGKVREFNIDHSTSFLYMLERQIQGQINSWAIRFYASSFVNDKFILFPGLSLTKQNGIDGSGTHSGNENKYEVELAQIPIMVNKIDVYINKRAYVAFRQFYLRISDWKAPIRRYMRILGLKS